MSPAVNPSLLSDVPLAADRYGRDADERLPVQQALMIIVLLASICWLGVGAMVAWLIG